MSDKCIACQFVKNNEIHPKARKKIPHTVRDVLQCNLDICSYEHACKEELEWEYHTKTI